MTRPLGIALAALVVLPLAAPAQEWETLFNGKDLTGWKGRPELWSVRDGAVTGYTKDGRIEGGNSFLVWAGTVRDFELKAMFKIAGGNSGIQYRSRHVGKPEDFRIAGYQADIDGSRGGAVHGILYEERGRGFLCNRGTKAWIDPTGARFEQQVADPAEILKAIKEGDWNEYHIIARGNHLLQKINDRTTAEVIDFQTDRRAMEGLLAFQVHANQGEMTIQFKDIRLKRLPASEEITPERMPIPPEAKKVEAAKPKGKKK